MSFKRKGLRKFTYFFVYFLLWVNLFWKEEYSTSHLNVTVPYLLNFSVNKIIYQALNKADSITAWRITLGLLGSKERTSIPRARISNYGPPPVVLKILLEHSSAHSFTCCLCPFSHLIGRCESLQQRSYGPPSLEC